VALPAEQIEAEALNLPLDKRARLAEALIASLDEDAEIERAWAEEIERRVKAIEAGTVELIPADEVFRDLRARLGR
jgi:putative addiction module component (TIGR02574 family)